MTTNRQLSRTLYWTGDTGLATHRLVVFPLVRAPRVNGRAVDQIDYAPLVGLRLILEAGGGWRNLTQEEEEDIDARLERMVQVGRAVWE